MARQVPRLTTDETAKAFLEQDLSNRYFRQFKAGQLEFERKDARVTMSVPQAMLDALKQRARRRGVPYQRLLREAIQRSLSEGRAGTARARQPRRTIPPAHG